jgi:hypothetical protein
MGFKCSKLSTLFGLLLIAITFSGLFFSKVETVGDEKEAVNQLNKFVEENMCEGKYDDRIKQIIELIKVIQPGHLFIISISSLFIATALSIIPQKNCLTWGLIHLVTLFFFLLAFIAGYLFFIQPSPICSSIKEYYTKPSENQSFYEIIKSNKYVQSLLKLIPAAILNHIEVYFGIFVQTASKLGVTAPIFSIVMAFYLLNSKTRTVTKREVATIVALIVSVIAGIEFYNTTNNIIFSCVLPIAAILLCVILISIAIQFGYILVIPAFLLSAYLISLRFNALLITFNIPFTIIIALVLFLILAMNTIMWSSGVYLTIVYLCYYGLSQLYPLKVEMLVIFVFIFSLFDAEPEVCEKKEEKNVKVKKD